MASPGWVQASKADFSPADDVPLSGPHNIKPAGKHLAWLSYCRRCGHVPLRNEISQLVTRLGCGYERDQRYQAWLARAHAGRSTKP